MSSLFHCLLLGWIDALTTVLKVKYSVWPHTHTYKHLYNTTQQIEPSVTAMQHCETHLTGFSFLVPVFVLVFHCFVLKFIRCCSAIIHPVESCYWNVCYMLTQTHTHTHLYILYTSLQYDLIMQDSANLCCIMSFSFCLFTLMICFFLVIHFLSDPII